MLAPPDGNQEGLFLFLEIFGARAKQNFHLSGLSVGP